MDDILKQDSQNEEAIATSTQKMNKAKVSGRHPKDDGDWKYQPWNGRDHWVNQKNGASTFDLKAIR